MLNFKLKYWLLKLSFLQRLRLYLIGGAILLVGIVFWFKVIPLGEIVYTKDYAQKWRSGKGFIYNFTPQDRVDESQGDYPRLIGDPVYFSVFTPRSFSHATVTVVYEDNLNSQTPILELGVLSDPIVWRYNLQPLENKIIDNLDDSWTKITEGSLSLYQKDQSYQNINKFLDDLNNQSIINCGPVSSDCLATYNYQIDLTQSGMRELGQLLDQTSSVNVDLPWQIVNPLALRGDHNLLLYVKDQQALELKVDLKPWSNNKAIKSAHILLFKNQELIASAMWPENNNTNAEISSPENISLNLSVPSLDLGVYKLEIKVNADVVIDKIQSTALAAVFINKIWPVSTNEEISIFTDSLYLQIKAMSPASLQTLSFNEEKILLQTAYQQTQWRLEEHSSINKVILEKDNVLLENNGMFTFFPEQLFNSTLKKVDRFFTPSQELKYILAAYEGPKKDAGQKEASAEFSLIGAYREQGKYNFMLSIPGLRAEDSEDSYLVVKKIIIEMKGRSLFEKIFNKPDKYKL